MTSSARNAINKIVFALFLVVVFSVGFMKPEIHLFRATLIVPDLLFPLLFLLWVVAAVVGTARFKWHPAYLGFAAYLLALLVASIFSIKPHLSFVKYVGIIYLVLLAVVTSAVVTSVERVRLFLLAWIAGAFIPVLIALLGVAVFYLSPGTALLEHVTYHYGAVPVGNFPRMSSTFVSPSMFCNYLTVTLIIALISKRMGWIGAHLEYAITISIAAAAAFTVSIALGGMILAAGLWIRFTSEDNFRSRLVAGGAVFASIIFLLISAVSLPSFVALSYAPSSRMMVWADAVTTFVENPITGKGPGTGAASVTFQNFDGTWSVLTDAHNSLLNVAAESGLVGVAGLLMLLVVVWRSARDSSEYENRLRPVSTGFWIALIAAFLYDGLTGSFEDARHLWLLIGGILAVQNLSKNKGDGNNEQPA